MVQRTTGFGIEFDRGLPRMLSTGFMWGDIKRGESGLKEVSGDIAQVTCVSSAEV